MIRRSHIRRLPFRARVKAPVMWRSHANAKRQAAARAAFTLLEMILALAIGLVLMSGLYMMMSAQLSQAQAGRESIEEATLARALLTRIANDIVGSLSAHDPSQAADAEAVDAALTGAPQFNTGVRGEADILILSGGRVPRELLLGSLEGAVCDLRRISYWMVPGKGLARQEVLRVTGEDIDTEPPDVDNPDAHVIAPEVKAINFQYWDPETEWITSWDGSAPVDAPVGPPAAIEITIELTRGTYHHVVTLPTGNNFSPPVSTTP
jgi:prepilin-type N-terminal cleavage/methylation domain-containing protein